MPATTHHAKPLRILHLTAGSDAGGISRYLHESSRAMAALGHEVLIAGERGAWHGLFESAQSQWIESPLKGGWFTLRTAADRLASDSRIGASSGRPGIDLIHAHYRRCSIVGRRIAKRLGVPMLFTLHLTGVPMGPLARRLSDFGDHTHSPSQQAKQWLVDQAKLNPSQITVIPHGIDPDKFPLAGADQKAAARDELGVPSDATVTAFVGRFDDPKNEVWVVDLAAAAQSRSDIANLKVLMIGSGPNEPAIREQIDRAGLAQVVQLLPYGDPTRVYQAADLVVIPSWLEGFSLVHTEAMSVGRAVLRTRTAGWQEHVIEGKTGVSVPINRTAFIDAGLSLLSDRTMLESMGLAAAEHVRTHLTHTRQTEATIDLYRELL